MERLEAAKLENDVLINEKREKASEVKVAAQKTRAGSRAAAFATLAAATDRGRRRSTLAVTGGDEEAGLEAGLSALHLRRTTGLSTPEPEENIDVNPAKSTNATNVAPPIPLISILKKPKTTNRTGTTAPTFPNLNLNSVSMSPSPPINKKGIRTVTFHPTATVQDTPVPYKYPHRAESEYRHPNCYHRTSEDSYDPGQWAAEFPDFDLASKGDGDGDDAGDGDGEYIDEWRYEGIVFAEEDVLRQERESG